MLALGVLLKCCHATEHFPRLLKLSIVPPKLLVPSSSSKGFDLNDCNTRPTVGGTGGGVLTCSALTWGTTLPSNRNRPLFDLAFWRWPPPAPRSCNGRKSNVHITELVLAARRSSKDWAFRLAVSLSCSFPLPVELFSHSLTSRWFPPWLLKCQPCVFEYPRLRPPAVVVSAALRVMHGVTA